MSITNVSQSTVKRQTVISYETGGHIKNTSSKVVFQHYASEPRWLHALLLAEGSLLHWTLRSGLRGYRSSTPGRSDAAEVAPPLSLWCFLCCEAVEDDAADDLRLFEAADDVDGCSPEPTLSGPSTGPRALLVSLCCAVKDEGGMPAAMGMALIRCPCA